MSNNNKAVLTEPQMAEILRKSGISINEPFVYSACRAIEAAVLASADNPSMGGIGLTTEHRAVIEEAAKVLESAAAHNRSKGRTVLERTQQDRATRLSAILAAPVAQSTAGAVQVPDTDWRKAERDAYIDAMWPASKQSAEGPTKSVGSIGDYTRFHTYLDAFAVAYKALDEACGKDVFAAADSLTEAQASLVEYINAWSGRLAAPALNPSEVREQALEEAAKLCQLMYESNEGGAGCGIAAIRIRALKTASTQGEKGGDHA